MGIISSLFCLLAEIEGGAYIKIKTIKQLSNWFELYNDNISNYGGTNAQKDGKHSSNHNADANMSISNSISSKRCVPI